MSEGSKLLRIMEHERRIAIKQSDKTNAGYGEVFVMRQLLEGTPEGEYLSIKETFLGKIEDAYTWYMMRLEEMLERIKSEKEERE